MAETTTFHFAWVDPSETTFVAGTHAREDEDIFNLDIAQTEGEFATAAVDVMKPEDGLLNPSRKQYAWISVTHDATTTALFFGRVQGVPEDATDDIITLQFVAQFPGWEDARGALFDSLKVLPFWDPAFIPEADLTDPDIALEARRALYHYDRVTGAVTLSDIIVGSSTEAVSDHFHGSVRWGITGTPARRVKVTATADWEQRIVGTSRRINTKIKNEFPGWQVNTFTGPAMEQSWPKAGDTLGGETGYQVVQSHIRLIGPLPSAMGGESTAFQTKISDGEAALAKALFGSTMLSREATLRRWWYDTRLDVRFDYRQSRSETITATIENDVQALAFDDDGGEIPIDLQAENLVQLGLLPRQYSTYFLTPRGRQSVAYLMARAQAALAASARAVEITFDRPFFSSLGTSCKNAVTLSDEELPGGSATGKIKAYHLTVVGETGETNAEITLGVSVGNGDTYTASGTEGDYCDDDYVGGGYQSTTGEDADADIPAIIFTPFLNQFPPDPAIISHLRHEDLIQSLTITNGPLEQDALLQANQFPARDNVASVVSANPTTIELALRSLAASDDLTHTVTVDVLYPFAAPKGIDLAA